MPAALIRKIALCLAIAAPAIVLRVAGFSPDPLLSMLAFGAAVVAASFLLAWAAEAAQKDIAGGLAIAILALIAVLPEYAVDLYYAFRSGYDPAYEQFAAANMTGSNRLLLGFGWPLVVIIGLIVMNRGLSRTKTVRRSSLNLPNTSRLDVGFLALLALIAFAIPVMGSIPIWFGIVLIAVFVLYLWRSSRMPSAGEEVFLGTPELIAELPTGHRRGAVTGLFVVAAAIILLAAEPFATALVDTGTTLGLDPYFLVQWLAPLASEAPEFIIAVLFAVRGMGAAAIATLIASKINQWSLLVGSLPIAHFFGGGGTELLLDARQIEEFVLTGSQTVMGVAIIITLRFHRSAALALAAIFAIQFFVTDTTGRYILSGVQLAIATIVFVVQRRHILPTLAAPFQRSSVFAAHSGTGSLAESGDRPQPESDAKVRAAPDTEHEHEHEHEPALIAR